MQRYRRDLEIRAKKYSQYEVDLENYCTKKTNALFKKCSI